MTLARKRAERGHEAHALSLLGEITSHAEPPEAETAQGYYREALALAETLGMRPLAAPCPRGLGRLSRREDRLQEAEEHIGQAAAMYHHMGMHFWQEQLNVSGT